MTRRVCASIPSGNGALSSSGSVGIWPVTKTQPSATTAWLVGATGVGAPGTIRNSIMAGIHLGSGHDDVQAWHFTYYDQALHQAAASRYTARSNAGKETAVPKSSKSAASPTAKIAK